MPFSRLAAQFKRVLYKAIYIIPNLKYTYTLDLHLEQVKNLIFFSIALEIDYPLYLNYALLWERNWDFFKGLKRLKTLFYVEVASYKLTHCGENRDIFHCKESASGSFN